MGFIYYLQYHLGYLDCKKLILTHNVKTMYGLDSFAIKFKEFNLKYTLNYNIGYFRYIENFESFLLFENNIVKYIYKEI